MTLCDSDSERGARTVTSLARSVVTVLVATNLATLHERVITALFGMSDLEPRSPKCAAALHELRTALDVGWLQDAVDSQALPGSDDFVLLRFLIAREFDVASAAAMMRARVEWAAEIGLAALLQEWTGGPEGQPTSARARAAQEIFYGGVSCGQTLGGAPIMVERLGQADLAGVNREGAELLQLILKSYTVYLVCAPGFPPHYPPTHAP